MKFLVIESDHALRQQLLQSLAGRGWAVDMVFNQEDALHLLSRFNYSVVIMGAGGIGTERNVLVKRLRRQVTDRGLLIELIDGTVTSSGTLDEVDERIRLPLTQEQWVARLTYILVKNNFCEPVVTRLY
ncbi:MAG: hypothetical protein PW845_04840 [Pseudomonas sp.]|nr:hypothetical protein [Pseudomonas sp.]